MKVFPEDKINQIRERFSLLYGKSDAEHNLERFLLMIGRYGVGENIQNTDSLWDESSAYLITYADMVSSEDSTPLQTLHKFCKKELTDCISTIHLLPFYPYTSDDGFSVVDYREVDSANGKWEDIEQMGKDFQLMFDLVLNHCSAESTWFKNYQLGIAPDRHYFLEMDPEQDLSAVTRPRTSPLLTPVHTRHGETNVWTTFSADQVDLNWQNPDLFFEFLDILFLYIAQGARVIRMDAIAFLWKIPGTTCIHLHETHEIVKLFRDIVDLVAPDVVLLTETNVPHEENISYFGNADEAHMVYNFSLPPLVLHALLNGNSEHLTRWAKSLDEPPTGCTYFNFTASHDGVGVRPLQGLLPDEELWGLADKIKARGGHISCKSDSDGKESPYEMNITYYSALSDSNEPLGIDRFLCSQAIALAFRGIPGVYFHSLTASQNNTAGVEETGRARTINRYKWNQNELEELLENKQSHHSQIYERYKELLQKRSTEAAFHPDAKMEILDCSNDLFALRRTSLDGNESIICLFNLSDKQRSMTDQPSQKLLSLSNDYYEIISGRKINTSSDTIILKPYDAVWLKY